MKTIEITQNLRKQLEKELKPDRFEHTLGVAYTASSMAFLYGADVQKALIAGFLHDCAKSLSHDEQVKVCEKNGIEVWREQVAAASSEELGECLYGETFADHLMAFIAQDNGNGIISYRISCISLQTPLWPGNPPSAPAETTP